MHCPDPKADAAMRARVEEIMQAKDTLGGVFEVVALGVPPGLGSHVHWDRRLSGRLAAALLSIHAMKGVEIGERSRTRASRGRRCTMRSFVEARAASRAALNRAGGLEGGITTGRADCLARGDEADLDHAQPAAVG